MIKISRLVIKISLSSSPLFPGQQLIRLSDGRLQLLTLPTVQQQPAQVQQQPEQQAQVQQQQPAQVQVQPQPAQVQLPALRPALAPAPPAAPISMPTIAAPTTIQLLAQGQQAQIKVLILLLV